MTIFTRVVFYGAWFALGAIVTETGVRPNNWEYWGIMAAVLAIHLAG